jgi:hypothetical protein
MAVVLAVLLFGTAAAGYEVVDGPYHGNVSDISLNYSMVNTDQRQYTGDGFTDNIQVRFGVEDRPLVDIPLPLSDALGGDFILTSPQDTLRYTVEERYNATATVNRTDYTWETVENSTGTYNESVLNWWNETQEWRYDYRPVQTSLSEGETRIINFKVQRHPVLGSVSTDFIPSVTVDEVTLELAEFAWFNSSKEFQRNQTYTDTRTHLVLPANGTSTLGDTCDTLDKYGYMSVRAEDGSDTQLYYDDCAGGGYNTSEAANDTHSQSMYVTFNASNTAGNFTDNIVRKPDNITGHWPLDVPSGSTVFDYMRGRHGVTSSETSVDGFIGDAFSFDGSDGGVNIEPDHLQFSEYTVSVWVNPDSINDGNIGAFVYLLNNNDIRVREDGDGNFYFYQTDGGFQSVSTSGSNGQWVHLAARWNGSYISLWKNGTEQDQLAVTAMSPHDTDDAFGHNPNQAGGEAYDGQLDEIQIYNRSLSGAEIKALSNLDTGLGSEETEGGGGDTTSPSVTIHDPTADVAESTPWLNVTADEAVDTWIENVDGTGNETFTPNKTLEALSDGSHTVNVYANDSSGNMGTTSKSFTVDTAAPSVSYNADSTDAGTYSQDWINVIFTGSDSTDSALTLYEQFNDKYNEANTTSTDDEDNAYGDNHTGLSDATYTYKAFAADDAGNTGAASQRSVTLDTTPPSTSDNWTKSGYQNQDSAHIKLICNDEVTSCSTVEYWVDGSKRVVSGSSATVDITSEGNHTVVYRSNDTVDNVESNQTEYVALDTPPVSRNRQANVSGRIQQGTPVELSVEWNGKVSGLNESVLAVNGTGSFVNGTVHPPLWKHTGENDGLSATTTATGIYTHSNENWYVADFDGEDIDIYHANRTHKTSEDISADSGQPRDLSKGNDGNWYVIDAVFDEIDVYDASWVQDLNATTYIGSEDTNPQGLEQNSTGQWFLLGDDTDSVYVYNSTWGYTGTSHNLSTELSEADGLYQSPDGTWWVGDAQGTGLGTVYKYFENWTYTGTRYALTDTSGGMVDITNDTVDGGWRVLDTNGNAAKRFYGDVATDAYVPFTYTWNNNSFAGLLGYKMYGRDIKNRWSVTDTGTVTVNGLPETTDNWTETGWQKQEAATIQLTCTDSTDACGNISHRVDGGAWTTEDGNTTTVTVSGEGNHSVEYNATDTHGVTEQTRTAYVAIDGIPPRWQQLHASETEVAKGTAVNVSIGWQDNGQGLQRAVLATNETGTWHNYTDRYQSPAAYTFSDAVTAVNVSTDLTGASGLYVAANNHRFLTGYDSQTVAEYTANWQFTGESHNVSKDVAGTVRPTDIANASNASLYVLDSNQNRVLEYVHNSSGWSYTGTNHSLPGIPGGNAPYGLKQNASGHWFVADYLAGNIVVYNQTWHHVTTHDTSAYDALPGGLMPTDTGAGTWQVLGLDTETVYRVDSQFNHVPDTRTVSVSSETVSPQDIGVTAAGNGIVFGYDPDTVYEYRGADTWVNRTFTWQNTSTTGTVGYRVWGKDTTGNWNRSTSTTVYVNTPPTQENATVTWQEIGGSTVREIVFGYDDVDGRDIRTVSAAPSGTQASTNHTATVTDWTSPFDWQAQVTDQLGQTSGSRPINVTRTSPHVLVENATGPVNESVQTVNTSASVNIRGAAMNYSITAAAPAVVKAVLQNADETTTAAVTGLIEKAWYWTTDTIANTVYSEYADAAYGHTLGTQGVAKNKELANNASITYSRVNTTPVSISGTCSNCDYRTIAVNANTAVNETYNSTGDFITGETEGAYQEAQYGGAGENNLSTQHTWNSTNLTVTNGKSFQFTNVDLSSRCSTTTSATVPSGTTEVTTACNNATYTVDDIEEKAFGFTPQPASATLGVNYLGNRPLQLNETRGVVSWTDFATTGGVMQLTGCTQTNNTRVNLTAGAITNVTVQFSCDPGQEINGTLVKTLDVGSDNHTEYNYTGYINVSNNETRGIHLIHPVSKDPLTDFGDRTSPPVAYIDGSPVGVGETVKTSAVDINYSTDCCTSSPNQGLHSYTLNYPVAESDTTTSNGGGGGGGGGGTGDGIGGTVTVETTDPYELTYNTTSKAPVTLRSTVPSATTVTVTPQPDVSNGCRYVEVRERVHVSTDDDGITNVTVSEVWSRSGQFTLPSATTGLTGESISLGGDWLRLRIPSESTFNTLKNENNSLTCRFEATSTYGTAASFTVNIQPGFSTKRFVRRLLRQAGAAVEAVFEAVFGPDAEITRSVDVCKPDTVDVPAAFTDARNTTATTGGENTTGDDGGGDGDSGGDGRACPPTGMVTVPVPTAEGAAFGLAAVLAVVVPVAAQRRYNL